MDTLMVITMVIPVMLTLLTTEDTLTTPTQVQLALDTTTVQEFQDLSTKDEQKNYKLLGKM